MLKGYKTYIVAAGIGLIAAAHHLGYIPSDLAATLTAMLGGGGLAALRAGMKNNA